MKIAPASSSYAHFHSFVVKILSHGNVVITTKGFYTVKPKRKKPIKHFISAFQINTRMC